MGNETINRKKGVNVPEKILGVGRSLMSVKGFSAVGLNEILKEANVPKGSFYHYFGSKDAFGVAVLNSYFEDYLAEIDKILNQKEVTMADCLLMFFVRWQERQAFLECKGKCLVVKLGAEVADLSEPMRLTLQHGTVEIIKRIAKAINNAVKEGTLEDKGDSYTVAESLFQIWLGASVMVKLDKNIQPFESAMLTTRQLLGLSVS
ncbi:TetR/AcrR family transcriptional regulator [Muricauda oceani]|uniref:TetR/AcrR family transcriptional regulator n=1 Tax=Flagellimonas oceani TaxID=2698672 RepID=A0A6G7IYU3_9FLAO|nr:TetR/AcrR family transcriptional regulator [Allomuricauda oceani]MBW8244910.1 TetR/AcrR family transcriptional regulator [Allomuricauda oceani]QII43570.1 TetR/AcrR family transcriptional regulator [Allomuricauda oceani]